MIKNKLIRHIDNFVGSGYGYVPRWAYRIYGESEWETLRSLLEEWQSRGVLEILKDPEHAEDNEYCTKMFNFIDATEPMPGNWISYDRAPPIWRPPTEI